MLIGDYFLLFGGLLISGVGFWVSTRPTVTAQEQDNLIRYGHK